MSENNVKAVVEALLFTSDKLLPLEHIKNVLDNLGTDQIRAVLEDLRLEYEKNNRGIRILEVAGGFRMITAPNFAPFLKKFYKERRVERLSKPALETLAIIAYKQPVTRLDVESIRSVNIDGVMRSLLDKDLIRISGHRKAPGRPFLFGTTRQFLEYFGLKSLEELPKIESLMAFSGGEGKNEPKESAQKD